MKIKCKVCRKVTEIDELNHTPGDKIIVECQRCGNELEAIIPFRDDETTKQSHIKNTTCESEGESSIPNANTDAIPEEKMKAIWHVENSDSSKASTNIKRDINISKKSISNSISLNALNKQNSLETSSISSNLNNAPKAFNKLKENTEKTRGEDPINSQHSSKTILVVGVMLAIAFIGAIVWWATRGFPNNNVYLEDSAYTVVEEAVEVVAEPVYTYDSSLYYSEIDTIDSAATDVVEIPVTEERVERIFVPYIASSTSSEAYEIYPPYVADDKFGDAWATTEKVQNAIRNNLVEYFVKGVGDIEGYPLSVEAVRLKDGRLYGRYHNDYNGVKLDINGVFDTHEDLVIKLGHKSETSYWILKCEGMDEDGILHYKGTWGKNNKSTELKIRAFNNL